MPNFLKKKVVTFAIIMLFIGFNTLTFIGIVNPNNKNFELINIEIDQDVNNLSYKELLQENYNKNQNSYSSKYDINSKNNEKLLDDYEYIIITIRDLEASFEKLVDHKSHYISTRVVTVEDDILPISDYWVNGSWGDNNPVNPFVNITIPEEYCELFNDTQSKIRNFIRSAVITMSTRFILLGGDVEIIPARSLWAYIPEWWNGEYEPKEENITSDVYYACLDGTWNDDFDSRFGEPEENSTEDEADFWSDVNIGRAPVNDIDEAKNFVNKIMYYEIDQQRPNIITLHQSGINPQNNPPSEVIPNKCLEHITGDYNVEKLYANDSVVTKEIWRDSFIDGRLIVLHVGNGAETLYQLDNINYPVVPIVWSIDDIFDPSFQNNFYPIHISIACNSGNFSKDDCLAEGFITREGGGASACIFNTNYGVTSPDDAQKYSGEFIEQIFIEMFVKGTENLGKIHQYAKESFLYQNSSIFNDPSYRWCYYSINLLGDPEMPVLGTERLGELPDRIWVDDDFNSSTPGWNISRFNSIQEGLKRVNSSGTVVVLPGVYYENVIIRKSIILEGGGMKNTVIDGRFIGDVVRVEADNVEVSGFSIRNSGNKSYDNLKFDAGIHVNSDNNIIHENNLSYNHMGILVDNSREGNHISGNFLGNNIVDGIGLYPSSKVNTIEDNTIVNNKEVGIFVYTSSNNIIKNNTITNNDLGIFLVERSNFNEITSNDVTWCTYNPDWPERSGKGIFFLGFCTGNTIKNNDIENNSNKGVELWMMSNFNKFIRNDFVDNKKNVYFINCIWNKWRENYYDDWPRNVLENLMKCYIVLGKLGPSPWPNFDWYPRPEPWPGYP